MVFVFFGLVAVLGTQYVQAERFTLVGLYAACGIGALACAILVANNLRDIPTDLVAGKMTLAVRLGDPRTRGAVRVPRARLPWSPWSGSCSGPRGGQRWRWRTWCPPAGPSRSSARASGRDLVPALQLTGVAELALRPRPVRRARRWARRRHGDVRSGMTFLIILVLIVAGVVAYKNRVTLIAKLPASRTSRIERRLNRVRSGSCPLP